MACFSELTYAIFVDDELPPEEASRVRAHLSTCHRCQALVAALRVENQALAEVLANPVTAVAKPRFLREFLILVAVIGLAGAGLSWLNGQTAPINLNWLNPFNGEGRINALFNLLFFLQPEVPELWDGWAALVGGYGLYLGFGGPLRCLPRAR